MRQIKIISLLICIFACNDQSSRESLIYPTVSKELEYLVRSEKAKNNSEPLMPKIINLLQTYGGKVLDPNSVEYAEKNNYLKLKFNEVKSLTSTPFAKGDECHLTSTIVSFSNNEWCCVWEYGSGCGDSSGCIENDWYYDSYTGSTEKLGESKIC